jgi:hypothetical protein
MMPFTWWGYMCVCCGVSCESRMVCVACCVLRVACCVLRVACCVLRVACCVVCWLRVACCVLRVACCVLRASKFPPKNTTKRPLSSCTNDRKGYAFHTFMNNLNNITFAKLIEINFTLIHTLHTTNTITKITFS